MTLIIQMVEQAKAILFQVIAERTGAMPPPDYMLTHESEFANAASAENHHAIIVWSWKGEPEARWKHANAPHVKANAQGEAQPPAK